MTGTMNWMEKLGWTEEHIEDLRHTGYSYIRQGKYEIALTFFEALTILDPHQPYDMQTLGALYLEMNQPAKALQYFDRALKLEKDHGPTLLNVAKALLIMGRKTEGLKIAHVLKENPDGKVSNIAKALILAYS